MIGPSLPPFRPQQGSRTQPTPPDVMVYSDIDDSLVAGDDQGLAASRDVLVTQSGRTVPGYSTGRGITLAMALSTQLAGFPMAFFAVNNGLNLFVNDQNLPADEFIKSLPGRSEDPAWAAEVSERSGGFTIDRVRDGLKSQLDRDGFVQSPTARAGFATYRRGDIQVTVPPDQPAFFVESGSGRLGESQKQFAHELSQRLLDGLGHEGVSATPGHFYKGEKAVHYLQPAGITKASLLEHLLSRYPSVHHTITVGDNVNDDMLIPEQFSGVTNYPVLAGHHHPDEDKLRQHPRMEWVESGAAAPGLLAQFDHIDHG